MPLLRPATETGMVAAFIAAEVTWATASMSTRGRS
jgi:hypothetical protein